MRSKCCRDSARCIFLHQSEMAKAERDAFLVVDHFLLCGNDTATTVTLGSSTLLANSFAEPESVCSHHFGSRTHVPRIRSALS